MFTFICKCMYLHTLLYIRPFFVAGVVFPVPGVVFPVPDSVFPVCVGFFPAGVVFPVSDSVFPVPGVVFPVPNSVFPAGVVFPAGGTRAHICSRSSRRVHAKAPQGGGRSRV